MPPASERARDRGELPGLWEVAISAVTVLINGCDRLRFGARARPRRFVYERVSCTFQDRFSAHLELAANG
jgi:hypothetical protein